jgi:hypothetical protein
MTYWGPLFPDRAGAVYLRPAIAARLALGAPLTASGALEHAFVEALVAGEVGNGISVKFTDDAVTSAGELVEDAGATPPTVQVKFAPGGTTPQDIANLLGSSSALVKLTGSWDSSALLVSLDDDFDFQGLAGGAEATSRRSTFWGPLFADRRVGHGDATHVAGVGPLGAAQFALHLESGFSVAYEWVTDVFKAYDGSERRASVHDSPRATYRGSAVLVGRRGSRVRSKIAKFAASGSTFLLGLSHESATIAGPSDGDGLVPLLDSAMLDWGVAGQRVAVIPGDDQSEDAADASVSVIQQVGTDEILLDVDPGDAAAAGADLVPLVPVVLEARQGFTRRGVPRDEAQGEVETWAIEARGASFGFRSGSIPARALLDGTAAFSGAAVYAIQTGSVGNTYQFQLVGDSGPGEGATLDEAGGEVIVHFEDSVSTAEDVADALAGSAIVVLAGSWVDADVLTLDDVVSINLEGGADEATAPVGRGATVTTYAGRPVWDRGRDRGDTADDSAQTMADVVDLGQAPASAGGATEADWGRRVMMTRGRDERAEEQWLKLFMWTARGRWKAFWLPTSADDLVAVADGPGGSGGSGELQIDAAVGDFPSWFELGFDHIQVTQGDAVYYLLVEGYQENGDGTITLEILADPDDPSATVPAAEPIDQICWLELCRFESDTLTVTHSSDGFSFNELARRVQR